MLTRRCRRENLINYLNQKDIEYSLNMEQIMDKSSIYYLLWDSNLQFNGNSYNFIESTKKRCIRRLMDKAENDIYDFLLVA